MDKVVHFEIPADDTKRAIRFYKDVFGWRIDKAPMDDGEYFLIKTVETDKNMMPKEAGAINGGLMKRFADESTVIVIDVKDIDDAIKKVENAGGAVVVEKMQVGDMGLYAKVKDTEGNIIGVWENLKKE